MPFEEDYEDVLKAMESAIVALYREHPTLTDSMVDSALDGLARTYIAEQKGRAAPLLKLTDLEQKVHESVGHLCNWLLGREPLENDGNLIPEPLTLEEIIACVKRVRKSIKLWTLELGKRGYFTFINRYIP